jgi:hypothetical protein
MLDGKVDTDTARRPRTRKRTKRPLGKEKK